MSSIKLVKKQTKLIEQLSKVSASMLKGSISVVCPKCGRMNCNCSLRGKTKAYRLTYSDYSSGKAKNKTMYVPKHMIEDAINRTEQFKLARDLIAEIIEINRELFKLEAKQQK